MEKYSTITIRGKNETKQVRIGSDLKPELQKSATEKWQSLIDTAARLAKVPSGLIMRLNEKTIEIFLKSNTDGNPYEAGEKTELVYGLYCETVIGTQKKLLVPDATKSDVWKNNNPDIDINMISYLGFPVNWPDGEVFGTICLLDNKENHYNKDYEDLLEQIKQHIEDDLRVLILNNDLKEKNIQLKQLNYTKSRFLSLISHDIRGSIGTIDEFINLIINNFDQYDKDKLKLILKSLSKAAATSYETLENLLGWSKNDIAQLQPDLRPVNLIDVIEKILRYFEQSIQMKEIKVTKSYYSSEAFVVTDENMITIAFRNIISNAIKYNYKNGELRIQVALENDNHEITIEDTGIGMSENLVKKLFTYNKEHTEGTQGESSAGIGLMLTKEFIDKLNAEISVKSKPGKGTSFVIKI